MIPEQENLTRELRQLVTELSLISHVSGVAYDGKASKATDEHIGGKKPPGGEQDRPHPPRDDDPKAWAAYRDELESWRSSYQRFTPTYFNDELRKCETTTRLRELRDQAASALAAWRRAPIPPGGEPASMADPQWKRWVIEEHWTTTQIVNRYGCSRQYVHQLRSTDRTKPAIHVPPSKAKDIRENPQSPSGLSSKVLDA